jgi:hypothetical protein
MKQMKKEDGSRKEPGLLPPSSPFVGNKSCRLRNLIAIVLPLRMEVLMMEILVTATGGMARKCWTNLTPTEVLKMTDWR